MADPLQATQVAAQLSRLRALHLAALARANHPPRLPEGAWTGPAAANHAQLADQFETMLRLSSDALGDAREALARELARVVS